MKVVNFALRSSPLSRIQKAFIYSSSKWRWLKQHQERCQAGGVKTKRQGRQADKPGSKSPIQPAAQSYLYLRDAREIHIANRRNQQRWRPQCSAASRLKSANGADECWLVHLAVKRSRSGDREREIKRERKAWGNQRGRGQRHCLRLAFRFLPCANFMAIYFVPANQLSHHQSFCLKEYIAIKSRKYAFTLAKSAT